MIRFLVLRSLKDNKSFDTEQTWVEVGV